MATRYTVVRMVCVKHGRDQHHLCSKRSRAPPAWLMLGMTVLDPNCCHQAYSTLILDGLTCLSNHMICIGQYISFVQVSSLEAKSTAVLAFKFEVCRSACKAPPEGCRPSSEHVQNLQTRRLSLEPHPQSWLAVWRHAHGGKPQ